VGFWSEQVVPRMTDVLLRNQEVMRHRREAVAGLRGVVLEIGFGSGLNVPVYPPEVERVLAVDPSAVGRALAAERIAASPVAVELVGLDGQDIPVDDASADAALSTFTLCTVPDAARALGEVRRILRPGGRLHFLEHGLCPDPAVARWQHRCNGVQQRIAAGCHLDRPVDRLVADAGFDLVDLRTGFLGGPKAMRPWGYLYEGVARCTTR
jgi:ubiquinone/menaquinone biosynthesis C-methylase UbiE